MALQVEDLGLSLQWLGLLLGCGFDPWSGNSQKKKKKTNKQKLTKIWVALEQGERGVGWRLGQMHWALRT